jgi:hypothetical protein
MILGGSSLHWMQVGCWLFKVTASYQPASQQAMLANYLQVSHCLLSLFEDIAAPLVLRMCPLKGIKK